MLPIDYPHDHPIWNEDDCGPVWDDGRDCWTVEHQHHPEEGIHAEVQDVRCPDGSE